MHVQKIGIHIKKSFAHTIRSWKCSFNYTMMTGWFWCCWCCTSYHCTTEWRWIGLIADYSKHTEIQHIQLSTNLPCNLMSAFVWMPNKTGTEMGKNWSSKQAIVKMRRRRKNARILMHLISHITNYNNCLSTCASPNRLFFVCIWCLKITFLTPSNIYSRSYCRKSEHGITKRYRVIQMTQSKSRFCNCIRKCVKLTLGELIKQHPYVL